MGRPEARRWTIGLTLSAVAVAVAVGALTVYTHVRHDCSPVVYLARLISPRAPIKSRPVAQPPARVINLDKPAKKIRRDRRQVADMKRFGLVKSLKIVVRSTDTIQARPYELKMAKVMDLINQRRADEGLPRLDERAVFGVRRVRRGDNLWDIHKSVLAEMLARFGLRLTRAADRPGTGVGRILLYAQKRVYLYSLQTEDLFAVKKGQGGVPWLTPVVKRIVRRDLNKIYPDQDLIVFNLGDLEPLRQWLVRLKDRQGQVTIQDLDRIQLDVASNRLELPPLPPGRRLIRNKIDSSISPGDAGHPGPDSPPWSLQLPDLTR
jgi:hypothetical protein